MAVAAECGRISASAARAAGLSHPPLESPRAAVGDGGALVPMRNPEYITCLALDGVPTSEWKAVGVDKSPRWWGPETCALWWADGERPLDEIISLVRLDMGLAPDEPLGYDLVGYFRMLARHGYVTLEERGQA